MPRKRNSESDEYKSILTRLGMVAQRRLPARVATPDWATARLARSVAARHNPERVAKFIRLFGVDYAAAERCSDANTPETCAAAYGSLNEFFTRRLRGGVRANASAGVVSPATCRCVLYDSFRSSTAWVKGRAWSAEALLGFGGVDFPDYAVGIFRLRPKDYHRFHCPLDATVAAVYDLGGRYLSVDPSVVRSSRDVLTGNHRVVYALSSPTAGVCWLVAVGAAGVGAVVPSVAVGDAVSRGDELGYFEFGGSTVVLLVPAGAVSFNSHIARESMAGRETYVTVGQAVGSLVSR